VLPDVVFTSNTNGRRAHGIPVGTGPAPFYYPYSNTLTWG
jgi:hypothetical protein